MSIIVIFSNFATCLFVCPKGTTGSLFRGAGQVSYLAVGRQPAFQRFAALRSAGAAGLDPQSKAHQPACRQIEDRSVMFIEKTEMGPGYYEDDLIRKEKELVRKEKELIEREKQLLEEKVKELGFQTSWVFIHEGDEVTVGHTYGHKVDVASTERLVEKCLELKVLSSTQKTQKDIKVFLRDQAIPFDFDGEYIMFPFILGTPPKSPLPVKVLRGKDELLNELIPLDLLFKYKNQLVRKNIEWSSEQLFTFQLDPTKVEETPETNYFKKYMLVFYGAKYKVIMTSKQFVFVEIRL